MTKLSIKPRDADKNQESLYITKEIQTSGQPIITPIIAYNNSLIRNDDHVAPITRGLNEVYCEIETQKTSLKKLVNNPKDTEILDQRIKSQIKKTNSNVFYLEIR